MTTDDYSENIDWDVIYRAFHDPQGVAGRILHEVGHSPASIIFCGFPEVASYLAAELPLQFVDYSPVIAARSRQRYPSLQRIINGEITDVLQDDATENVVISCRLSAFWQTPEAFEKLAAALLSFPRKQILIDFFDRDAVYEEMSINYESVQGTGTWRFKKFFDLPPGDPLIQIADLDICYAVGSMRFSYETRRAFFTRASIESWCKKTFVGFETRLAEPLLQDDPSFLLKLQRI